MTAFNVELEQAIRENRDDVARWRTYADWLLARGQPRGELMALMLDGKRGPEVNALVQQLDGASNAGYRFGFKDRQQVAVFDAASVEKLERLFSSPGMRLLRHLILQLDVPIFGANVARVADALARAPFAPGLADLELLAYDGLSFGRAETEAFARAFAECRAAKSFIGRGELAAAPPAKSLSLTCRAGVAAAVLRSAPQIESLTLKLLEREEDVLGVELPALRALNVWPVDDALLGAVLAAPCFVQLTRLALHLVPAAVPALIGAAPRLLAVNELQLHGLWRDSPEWSMVAAAFPRAKLIANVRM